MKLALWLIPDEKLFYKYSFWIKELASEYDTPLFEPHLTLVSGIDMEAGAVKKKLSPIISELAMYELTTNGLESNYTYYQRLFVAIQQHIPLLELRSKLLKKLYIKRDEYTPHLSLLYGDLNMIETDILLHRYKNIHLDNIKFDKLWLVKTEGLPHQWEILEMWQLSTT